GSRLNCISDLGSPHHGRREMLDCWRAELLHDNAQFSAQELEHPLDPGLAERAETPDIGPADAHSLCTHTERLGDVGAAAKAAVDKNWHPAAHRFDNFRQGVDGRAPAVFGARSVIRDDDRVDTGVSRELGILISENALDYDFHFGCVAQPLEKIPCHRGRLVLTHDESCKVDSIIHGSAPHVSLQAAAVVTSGTFTRVGAL